MKKLHRKNCLILTLIAVIVIAIATILCVIYYTKPVCTYNFFQIYRTDKFTLSDHIGPPGRAKDDEWWEKTKFNKEEKKIICEFLKNLKIEKTHEEQQMNVGLPPELIIKSRHYEVWFKLWSSHGIESGITYYDEQAEGKPSRYYDFVIPEENFKEIISLIKD